MIAPANPVGPYLIMLPSQTNRNSCHFTAGNALRRRPLAAPLAPSCRDQSQQRLIIIVLLSATLALSGCWSSPSTSPDPTIRRLEIAARQALIDGDLERSTELATQLLKQAPNSVEGRIVAGYAAASRHQVDTAFRHYSQIPDDANPRSLEGRCLLAQLLFFDMGRAADAERCYRRILEHDPDHGLAHQGLATLMEFEGRRWELVPHMLRAIRAGRCEAGNLLAVGWVQLPTGDTEILKNCRTIVADDPLPLLGLARIAVRENEVDKAMQYLKQLVGQRPDQWEAQALLGQLLIDSDGPEAWLKWHSQLASAADELPDIWFVRGLWAERQGELHGAVHCFAESCRRDPDHAEATFRLSRALTQLGCPDLAAPFLDRSRQLELIGQRMGVLHSRPNDSEALIQVTTMLEGLGRKWEAFGWLQVSRSLRPDSNQGASQFDAERHNWPLQRTEPRSNPALSLDLTPFSMPTFRSGERSESRLQHGGASSIRFDDDSSKMGITFQYFNGRESQATGSSLAESAGGGVAVIDYDGDGWPDLFLSQGANLRERAVMTDPSDKLYRNLCADKFEDVTDNAGLVDRDFGQGATVGDFNDDGFPDLYVANVGLNRLYQNNGDGTFTDVSPSRQPQASYWTSSVVMADFNGDGFSDLFDCTYVAGDDAATRVCTRQGLSRVCSPLNFEAERDRLFLNSGDGHFQEIGLAAGIGEPKGKGLGVVTADFDGAGRLSLFVANDLEANSYFHNDTPNRGPTLPVFTEQALQNGLAFDEGGRAQACMGVAIGDANGDGLLDLFTTNYYLESNTLYVGQGNGLFADATRKAGLRDAGYHMLGFGTQFLDFDLDGALDLVVANGHLDDFTHESTPFQMRPQAFWNNGAGQFVELKATEAGAYFQQKCLGRGLARLDWNRDGLEEFAVSHLDRPFALLTNGTVPTGQHLSLALRGRTSCRDAIGTIVTASVGGKLIVRQLTAGDGYMASNQREIVIGLGSSGQIDRLVVQWPSGETQTFDELDANQHFVLVEGGPLRTQAVPR